MASLFIHSRLDSAFAYLDTGLLHCHDTTLRAPTVVNGLITQWLDASGNGRALTVQGPAAGPSLVDDAGLTVRFTGGAGLGLDYGQLYYPNGYTFACLVRRRVYDEAIFFRHSIDSSKSSAYATFYQAGLIYHNGSGGYSAYGSASTNWELIMCTMSPAGGVNYHTGYGLQSMGNPGGVLAGPLLGASSTVDYRALLVYQRVLSGDELSTVRTQLASRHGLSL